MHTQSATLDLSPWNDVLPKQERPNDPDYNALLSRFKQFYNEVKNFHEQHNNNNGTSNKNKYATLQANTKCHEQTEYHQSSKDDHSTADAVSTNFHEARSLFKNKILNCQQSDNIIPKFASIGDRCNKFEQKITKPSTTNDFNKNKLFHSASVHNLVAQQTCPHPPIPTRTKKHNNGSAICDAELTTKISKSFKDRIFQFQNNRSKTDTDFFGTFSKTKNQEKQTSQPNPSTLYEDDANIYDVVFNDEQENSEQYVGNSTPILSNRANIKPNLSNEEQISKSDTSKKTNSSLLSNSLEATALNENIQHDDSNYYSNYVNIDFFLKSKKSLSNEDNDNDSEINEDNLTHPSNSYSSDKVYSAQLPQHMCFQGSQAYGNTLSTEDSISSDEVENEIPETMSSREFRLDHFYSPTNMDVARNQLQVLNSKSLDIDRDESALVEANNMMKSFVSDMNLSSIDSFFDNKAQRRIVKESFVVESSANVRKLRHLFLFNDLVVCAKYQASSKHKFTFDVRWYLGLDTVVLPDLDEHTNLVKYDKEAVESQIFNIRASLMILRGQMIQMKRNKQKLSLKAIKKLKKKRTELEADLVLLLPNLPLVLKNTNGKSHTFFLSSNFDRNQWIESIKILKSQLPPDRKQHHSPSASELQAWIQTCQKSLNPNLGTFLLMSNNNEDLLYGDLHIKLTSIEGFVRKGNYYLSFEVDSYGHFSHKATSTVISSDKSEHELNEEYMLPLDGSHTLRVFLHENSTGKHSKSVLFGKSLVELSKSWLTGNPVGREISFGNNIVLIAQVYYKTTELLSTRDPNIKLCPTSGLNIMQVCKKEKSIVPSIVRLCVEEVERRGLKEVGIYRMSGTSTDIQRLKKAFEANANVGELLMRDIDIHSVTGFLKTYLREMPEGLFTDKLHAKFVAAYNMPQSEQADKEKKMLELFLKVPKTNQATISYLVEHLVRVNKFEEYNKMSLTNLATVLGPNVMRQSTKSASLASSSNSGSCNSSSSSDPFTALVVGSMSQAGVLYFFLHLEMSKQSASL